MLHNYTTELSFSSFSFTFPFFSVKSCVNYTWNINLKIVTAKTNSAMCNASGKQYYVTRRFAKWELNKLKAVDGRYYPIGFLSKRAASFWRRSPTSWGGNMCYLLTLNDDHRYPPYNTCTDTVYTLRWQDCRCFDEKQLMKRPSDILTPPHKTSTHRKVLCDTMPAVTFDLEEDRLYMFFCFLFWALLRDKVSHCDILSPCNNLWISSLCDILSWRYLRPFSL
jgi:hypothetical protein